MLRCTAVWTGFSGAPGYTNLYFGEGLDALVHTLSEATTCLTRVKDFFFNWQSILPASANVAFLPTVAAINPGSGELTNEFTVASPPAALQGAGAGAFAGPTGAAVTWRTGTIVAGKKLRGRTFLVPLVGSAFEANGTLLASSITNIQAGVSALLGGFPGTGENLVVWKRPVGGSGGAVGQVTGGTIADKAAVLRSRRD